MAYTAVVCRVTMGWQEKFSLEKLRLIAATPRNGRGVSHATQFWFLQNLTFGTSFFSSVISKYSAFSTPAMLQKLRPKNDRA